MSSISALMATLNFGDFDIYRSGQKNGIWEDPKTLARW